MLAQIIGRNRVFLVGADNTFGAALSNELGSTDWWCVAVRPAGIGGVRTINLRLSMLSPAPGPYRYGRTDSGATPSPRLVKKPLYQLFQSRFALRQARF